MTGHPRNFYSSKISSYTVHTMYSHVLTCICILQVKIANCVFQLTHIASTLPSTINPKQHHSHSACYVALIRSWSCPISSLHMYTHVHSKLHVIEFAGKTNSDPFDLQCVRTCNIRMYMHQHGSLIQMSNIILVDRLITV